MCYTKAKGEEIGLTKPVATSQIVSNNKTINWWPLQRRSKTRQFNQERKSDTFHFWLWVQQSKTSGSFRIRIHLTDEQRPLESPIKTGNATWSPTKRKRITANKDKYSISARCRCLNFLRSSSITRLLKLSQKLK